MRDIPKNERALEGIIRRTVWISRSTCSIGNGWSAARNSATGEIKGGILRGDFGYSRTASQPVVDMIKRRFPASMELAMWAVIPVVSGGVILGVIAAVNHNKPTDHLARIFGIVGWSFPDFVFGLLMLMLFYAGTGWFPPGRVSDWANQVIMSPEFRNYTK